MGLAFHNKQVIAPGFLIEAQQVMEHFLAEGEHDDQGDQQQVDEGFKGVKACHVMGIMPER